MPRKKNPREMTSEELAKHLFHPKAVKHLKAVIAEAETKKKIVKKKATK